MGLPIVATDIRGCRQVVDDGVTGLLVPVDDADALGAALHRVGVDGALRTRMGRAARAKAVERVRRARRRGDRAGDVRRGRATARASRCSTRWSSARSRDQVVNPAYRRRLRRCRSVPSNAMPAADLVLEPAPTVAHLDRRPGEPVAVRRTVGIRPDHRDRRRLEPTAYDGFDVRGGEHALRVREVVGGSAQVLLDQRDRTDPAPTSAVGPSSASMTVCVMRVRADGDEATRARVTQRAPAEWSGAVVVGHLPLDEVGGEVERGGDAVALEHGCGMLGEVGGAVVEGDDHRVRDRPRGCRSTAADASSSVDDRCPARARCAICSSNASGVEVDLQAGPAPTQWYARKTTPCRGGRRRSTAAAVDLEPPECERAGRLFRRYHRRPNPPRVSARAW